MRIFFTWMSHKGRHFVLLLLGQPEGFPILLSRLEVKTLEDAIAMRDKLKESFIEDTKEEIKDDCSKLMPLISAAPDMLAALESIKHWHGSKENAFYTCDRELIEAAITKAKGESYEVVNYD